MTPSTRPPGLTKAIFLLLALLLLCLQRAAAQDCSKLNPCATGCCSKFGYCGTGDEFCGADCVDTCDYKLGCDAENPCESGCCNKYGFCGLGPDYCGDDCVAGCDSKAYCDPGFGAEWSEVATCPLNVCCSKYGFCGTTEEFCGDRKVKRPSCSKTNNIKRVVGYYETWAPRRPCNQFWPENIPLGVYTHLIVAFAFIDPETFEIHPASTRDIDLYQRVTYLKNHDPELKVYIAIGGWSYNDPGPTATTFSDLAASEENQKKFFRSLTKFMATYNFDGLDLDWEYPVADDRSGRPDDFKNFPILLKNLKAALKATGGRSGLSITLPASYWYLQHFDIQKMAKYVDWFNVMSYDLHGTWDKGNKWLGEYLNAHTNLTEITSALDLIWRNHIPAEQVVLGLAFYARAFTVVDPGCTKPGCLFASGAEPGPCSKEVGILLNSEISDIMDDKTLTPTLHKDAAVKVMTWDDQWVAYDDADTWKLKTDFARSQCLGGVMVWAVSHDLPDGSYSKALAGVVGRKHLALAITEEKPKTKTIYHDQCKWTNCGEGCPTGWKLMPRLDPGHRENEMMLDDQGCHLEGQSHLLCCPADEELPTCGWWTHNNGDCDGTCPDGMFEIGGNSKHCSGVNGNYQAACCTQGTKSVALYDNCVWGDSFNCDSYQCPNTKPDIAALSYNGNGGSSCGRDWWTNTNEKRKFCCDTSQEDLKWTDCTWEDRYSPLGFLLVPEDGSDFCASNCPSDKVRVAMEHDDVCRRKTGSRALCCTPQYTTTVPVVDQVLENKKRELMAWYDSGANCGDGYSWWGKRSTSSSSYEKRQYLSPFYYSNEAFETLADLIYAYGSDSTVEDLASDKAAWDATIGLTYDNLALENLIACAREYGEIPGNPERFASSVMCNLESWNNLCGRTSDTGTCAAINLDEFDPEFSVDPDIYGTVDDIEDDVVAKRDLENLLGHVLDKRDGASREFTVDCGIDDTTGLRRVMIIVSHPYPNGNDGYNLEILNGLTVRFALQNANNCTDATIDANSPQSIWIWITEHILELQLIPRGIEFMVTGTMPSVQDLAEYDSGRQVLPWDAAKLLNIDYSGWAAGFTDLKGSPMERIWHAVGSNKNPHDLVNTESRLNSVKGRMFGGRQPIGNSSWANMNGPDVHSANAAIGELRLVFGVYRYINQQIANRHLLNTYRNVKEEYANFDAVYNKVSASVGGGGPPIDTQHGWRTFMVNFMNRMTAWVRPWMERHIRELREVWTEVFNVSTGTAQQDAQDILEDLEDLQVQLERGDIDFDSSVFIYY